MNNLFNLLTQFNQFRQTLDGMTRQTGKTPEQILDEELKRRNISREQLETMLQQAKDIKRALKF